LHFGDQNITAAVKPYSEADATEFEAFAAQAEEHVQRARFPEVIRLMDREYGRVDYSLTSLFRDEQRRIVHLILNSTLWDIENSLTTIYEDHASLLHFLSQAGLPKPPALTLAGGIRHQRGTAARARDRSHRHRADALVSGVGQGGQSAARDRQPLLHRRPAHEANHGGTADVRRVAGDAGPCIDAGAQPGGTARST
jgi:hypothetical protein